MNNGLKIYQKDFFKIINMPFNLKSVKKAGKKSKRGLAKKEGSFIKEKMDILYEKVLDDLLINQDKLTKTERVKVFITLSNYIFPKTKSVRDMFILDKIKKNKHDWDSIELTK